MRTARAALGSDDICSSAEAVVQEVIDAQAPDMPPWSQGGCCSDCGAHWSHGSASTGVVCPSGIDMDSCDAAAGCVMACWEAQRGAAPPREIWTSATTMRSALKRRSMNTKAAYAS